MIFPFSVTFRRHCLNFLCKGFILCNKLLVVLFDVAVVLLIELGQLRAPFAALAQRSEGVRHTLSKQETCKGATAAMAEAAAIQQTARPITLDNPASMQFTSNAFSAFSDNMFTCDVYIYDSHKKKAVESVPKVKETVEEEEKEEEEAEEDDKQQTNKEATTTSSPGEEKGKKSEDAERRERRSLRRQKAQARRLQQRRSPSLSMNYFAYKTW